MIGAIALALVAFVIIDGDTIKAGGESLRLVGIDAPEMSQPLGQASRDHLRELVGDGTGVECSWSERDVYGRPLATCGRVNRQMVRDGWAAAALPYGYEYERQQSLAMKDCLGMWAELPWCYRQAKR